MKAGFDASVTNTGAARGTAGEGAGAGAETGACTAGLAPKVKAGLVVSAGLAGEEVVESVKGLAPNVNDGALEVDEGG